MIQLVSSLFLFTIIITVNCTTRIGQIKSAAYVPTNSTNTLLYNGTCSECICFAFVLNISSTYQALNCYINNMTCLLFTSFLSQSYIQTDANSKLVFLQLPTNTTAASAVNCANVYDTCGGTGWTGLTNCCAGSSCVYVSQWYSQCLATSDPSTTTVTSIPSSTTVSYFNGSRQNATTSTYWDCCKVSCGWPGKASVTSPAQTCQQDGFTPIDSNTQSVCVGGSAYMCTNQQPWNVNSSLSYGYAGAGIIGESESAWCCACYSLLFTSGPVIGKEMIVQVINTAYSASSMFILQIPGSGWSDSSNGCLSQFNGSYSWGNQYGGVVNRSDCNNLPGVIQAGCYWRFDWFMNADEPAVQFREVSCPSALTSMTGCNRV